MLDHPGNDQIFHFLSQVGFQIAEQITAHWIVPNLGQLPAYGVSVVVRQPRAEEVSGRTFIEREKVLVELISVRKRIRTSIVSVD